MNAYCVASRNDYGRCIYTKRRLVNASSKLLNVL